MVEVRVYFSFTEWKEFGRSPFVSLCKRVGRIFLRCLAFKKKRFRPEWNRKFSSLQQFFLNNVRLLFIHFVETFDSVKRIEEFRKGRSWNERKQWDGSRKYFFVWNCKKWTCFNEYHCEAIEFGRIKKSIPIFWPSSYVYNFRRVLFH